MSSSMAARPVPAASNFGDYQNTGDRAAEFRDPEGDWEAIPTTNESYGYHKFDNSHKPPEFSSACWPRSPRAAATCCSTSAPWAPAKSTPRIR